VRDAFQALGHIAFSCDIEPDVNGSPYHFQEDIFTVLDHSPVWDLAIFFPPCTYLAASGLHWNKRIPGRQTKTEEALRFVERLLDSDVPCIALENPVGCISTRIRRPDQYIQPHQFGDDASKKTGLWLKNLPPLTPTKNVEPRMVGDRPRWANQTDSGQNRLGPSDERAMIRSMTYPGIATAMAEQWSKAAGAYLQGTEMDEVV
jgi:hypothetical protein